MGQALTGLWILPNMTLPESGVISLVDIKTEFTGPTVSSLTDYYRGGSYVPDTALNIDIPTSGVISITDFYGASSEVPPSGDLFLFTSYGSNTSSGDPRVFDFQTTSPITSVVSYTSQHVPSGDATNDGSLIAWVSNASPYIHVADTSDWSEISTGIATYSLIPQSVVFSIPGDTMAVSRGPSPDIHVYSTTDWSTLYTITRASAQELVRMNVTNFSALRETASPYVSIWDMDDWTVELSGPAPGEAVVEGSMSFSKDDSMLALAVSSSNYLRVYNTSDWSSETIVYTFTDIPKCTCFSNDGSLLAVGMSNSLGAGLDLVVLDTSTWDVIGTSVTQSTNTTGYTTISFSPDDSMLFAAGAASGANGVYKLYDTSTWTLIDSFSPNGGSGNTGRFSKFFLR